MGSSSGSGLLGSVAKPVKAVGGNALKAAAAPLSSKTVRNIAAPLAATAAVIASPVTALAGIAGYSAVKGVRDMKKANAALGESLAAANTPASTLDKKIETQQTRLTAQHADETKKLNKGIARAGRRRIKGGLFGDAEPTPGTISSTLG